MDTEAYKNGETHVLSLTARHLAAMAVRRRKGTAASGLPALQEMRPSSAENGDRRTLTFSLSAGGMTFLLTSEIDAYDGDTVTLSRVTCGDPHAPSDTVLRLLRTEGFCALYGIFVTEQRLPTLRLILTNPESGDSDIREETPDHETLSRFSKKLCELLLDTAYPELLRRTERLPSFRALRFPLPDMRDGQRELIEAATEVFHAGGTLFACAPTGTGKTLAALYPAIRALGDGHGEKIFYFTPKATGALAAAEAAEMLHTAGADIRAVILTAKAKICPREADCRSEGGTCRYLYSPEKRENEAALALLRERHTVLTPDRIKKAAEHYRVCPYELTLRYAELADLVICDYNYLFDLRVYLRRFFDEGGDYLYLFDEAHALVERAEAMYSGEWQLSDFDELLLKLPKECKLYATIYALRQAFTKTVAPLLKSETRTTADGDTEAYLSLSTLPDGILPIFLSLGDAVEEAIKSKTEPPPLPKEHLRDYLYRVQDFSVKLSYFSRKFRAMLFRQNRALRLKIFCLDPSDLLGKRLDTGRSAFFFSATLLPIEYYRTVLGGDRNAVTVIADSPFERERVAVAVIDKLSVRYHARKEGLASLLAYIETAVRQKSGNYLVFCPSFAYMEALHRGFSAAYPHYLTVAQERTMPEAARRRFLDAFLPEPKQTLVGFAVSGGIFAEGIDLVGDRLIGAVVIGIGLPTPTPEREETAAYFDDRFESGREYAYIYPGFNRVLQAAGRVIRRESDRGIILLIDDRFADPVYRRLLPSGMRGLRYIGDRPSLAAFLSAFWRRHP